MHDFRVSYGEVRLRPLKEEDITPLIRWHTVETEWSKWDAPWEAAVRSEAELRDWLTRRLKQALSPIPGRLVIEHSDGQAIGWVNTYLINGDDQKRAVGIDICESSYWGQGLGYQAFNLWIGLMFHLTDLTEIYCETWSGNLRMIALAEKCGFTEVKREQNKREVHGRIYDGLTFRLERVDFANTHCELMQTITRQLQA